MKLPSGIFRPLESHERAQEIAKKAWISEDLIDELDPLVRKAIRSKKRRATDGIEKPRKKAKGDRPIKEKKIKAERPIKTPKKKRTIGDDEEGSDLDGGAAPSSGPRRKSGRHSTAHKSYVEVSSDEEDVAAVVEQHEEEEESEANEKSSPAPEEDVEMADAEKEVEPEPEVEAEASEASEQEPSSEPDPEPPKRAGRGRSTKKAAGDAKPGTQKRKAPELTKQTTLVKTTKSSAKGKAKVNGTAAVSPSSPAINGTRRSGRTRS
jgi:sister-chromatid-cohesion protein PDS5